jgi:hypothetical protein
MFGVSRFSPVIEAPKILDIAPDPVLRLKTREEPSMPEHRRRDPALRQDVEVGENSIAFRPAASGTSSVPNLRKNGSLSLNSVVCHLSF